VFADDYTAGRAFLIDLRDPNAPKRVRAMDGVPGFEKPHSFARLANDHVIATLQYGNGMKPGNPGGIAEFDANGKLVRSVSSADSSMPGARIRNYGVELLPAIDRMITTSAPMDTEHTANTVQLWRLSDLTLLRSIALAPGPRGDEQRFTGEPRLLPDGKSVYIHTFNCGLYLVRGVDGDRPTSTFVTAFEGKNCGVPVLTGHYWLQTVPDAHALVALDIADPEHPRTVSTLKFADDEYPHWIAIDRTGRRVVLNSASGASGNRLYVVDLDPATGGLTLDERFRDAGATRAGVSFTQRKWPHGFSGTAVPHGTVFSR